MRASYKLILTMVTILTAVNVLVIFLGGQNADQFIIANGLAYFIVALFFYDSGPKIKSYLNIVSAVVFTVFLAVVALKVIELLS